MKTIPLFPLSRPLFPGGILDLQIFEVRYLDMVRRCIDTASPFGVVWLLEGGEVRAAGVTETLATIGTMAQIDEWHEPMPALMAIRCTGTTRFQLLATRQEAYGLWVGDIAELPAAPQEPVPAAQQAAADQLVALLNHAGAANGRTPVPVARPYRADDCDWVANRWAELLPMAGADRQRLLATQNPLSRLDSIYQLLQQRGIVQGH